MSSYFVLCLILVLFGLSSCLARPTKAGEVPDKLYKKAANVLLKTSKSVQEWGNQVLDASNSGFTTDAVRELGDSMTEVMEHTNTNLEPYLVMMTVTESGSVDTPKQRPSITDEATALLKEGVSQVVLTEDDRLLLIAGAGESADSTRLRLNVRLFERIMARLESTIEDLMDLMAVGDEQDIKDEFLDFVSEIASESMGLSIIFSGIETSSAQQVINPSRQRRSIASDCVMLKQE